MSKHSASCLDNRLAPLPKAVCNIFLFLVFLVMAIPMWNVIVVSTSTALQASQAGLKLWWTGTPSLEGYLYVFQVTNLARPLLNSLFVSVVGTSAQVVLSSLAGYILIQRDLPFQRSITTFIFLTMMIPSDLTLVSIYQMNKQLHLINTYSGLILNGLISGFCIMLMRNYFLSVPYSLAESARMDNAGEVRIFASIYMPISLPGAATIFFLEFVGKWNSLMLPATLISEQELYTLPLTLKQMILSQSSVSGTTPPPENAIMATIVISTIPLIFLSIFAHRFLLAGMTLGASKE